MTIAGSVGMALALAVVPAMAETYTASTWLPPTYELSSEGYDDTLGRIAEESGGEIAFDIHYSGALLPARTTLSGIRDGVAQVGLVYPPYTPAELPVANLLNSASFLSEDSLVAALAYTEISYTNDTVRSEWLDSGVVFGGGYSTPVYNLLCNAEVTTLDQAQGKRLRTASSAHSEMVGQFGGSPVSAPIGDVYSGMQRGSLECAVADPTNLVTASFNEVVKNITEVPLGVVVGATWVYNAGFWTELTADQRSMLIDEMALGLVRTQRAYHDNVANALADAETRGIAITAPAADLEAFVDDFKSAYLEELTSNGVGNLDAAAVKALVEEYLALQDRWAATLEGVDRTDEAALQAVIKENLVSKVDPETYGILSAR